MRSLVPGPGGTGGVPTGYHAPEAFSAAVADLVSSAGPRARCRTIGHTVEGRPIDAVTVSGVGAAAVQGTPLRPQALVVAAMHGLEVIASELGLAVLAELCTQPPVGAAAALLADVDVTVVPCLNVDGRTATLASLDGGWGPGHGLRRNAHGVDLNRNWPLPAGVGDHWLPLAGTSRSWLPWYRGRAPLSEPESAALADLAEELAPVVVVNLHSTGCILTHPWSSKVEAPVDQEGFDAMVAAFTATQRFPYRSKQSRAWYPIVGSSNDWFYDHLGALAMTVETSPPALAVRRHPARARHPFWYANPDDPATWIANDLAGCIAALRAGTRWRARHPRN